MSFVVNFLRALLDLFPENLGVVSKGKCFIKDGKAGKVSSVKMECQYDGRLQLNVVSGMSIKCPQAKAFQV